MSVRREKKSRSLRGWRTHSWGRVGQHRRSGRKGGRGKAGLHKHKWSWVVKYQPDYFGKRGFTRHPSITPIPKTINVGEVNERVKEWLAEGKVTKEGNAYLVDLPSLGYSKLLGRGEVTLPLIIKVLSATKSAISKVEEAGGKVEVVGGSR
ncbi:MAG: 50S ribosomal protein L15 [Thermofilum sp. ex4484_15]|nr:MAG: 50S ribosomal protein L15 [Thermofilum sp. ex4484_15]